MKNKTKQANKHKDWKNKRKEKVQWRKIISIHKKKLRTSFGRQKMLIRKSSEKDVQRTYIAHYCLKIEMCLNNALVPFRHW